MAERIKVPRRALMMLFAARAAFSPQFLLLFVPAALAVAVNIRPVWQALALIGAAGFLLLLAVTFNAARQMSQNGDLARYLKATLHSTMLGRAILRHYDRANR